MSTATPTWTIDDEHECPGTSYRHIADGRCAAYAIEHGDRTYRAPKAGRGHPGWCPTCGSVAWREACAVGLPEYGHGCHCTAEPIRGVA